MLHCEERDEKEADRCVVTESKGYPVEEEIGDTYKYCLVNKMTDVCAQLEREIDVVVPPRWVVGYIV